VTALGEMEVWALEAYGAAYTLQEMLTVKSDDVNDVPRCTRTSSRANTRSTRVCPNRSTCSTKEIRSWVSTSIWNVTNAGMRIED